MKKMFSQSLINLLSVFLGIVLSFIVLFFPNPSFAAQEEAIFAGGCFWCMEHDFEELPGVISVESGYSGGLKSQPTYQDHKGYQEAVNIKFESDKINYEKLLRVYWRNIDPLDGQGQFCDKGDSYRPVIFYIGDEQKKQALESSYMAAKELNQLDDNIKVEIKPSSKFWKAENYHQNYAENNKIKYNFYRYSCGRDARLEYLWGDKAGSQENWKTN